jgi:hypothetical protein
MWDFPSIQIFISSNGFFIAWTLGISVITLFCWVSVFFSIKNNTRESAGEFVKNVAIGSVTLLIFILCVWSLGAKLNSTARCRNLDLNEVKAIRVKKMASENSYGSFNIVIHDSAKIREGLKILRGAYSRERKKEQFINGYQIQLVLENPMLGEFNIFYFAENQNGDKVDFVVPQCANEYEVLSPTKGNGYSSSTFGEWLRENVEPEFKKVQ